MAEFCPTCPAPGRCPNAAEPHAELRGALCARAGAEPGFRAVVVKHAAAGPGERAPGAETEPELLAVLKRCPHAKLCGCAFPGIDCQPSGKHPGRRTKAECEACLSETTP